MEGKHYTHIHTDLKQILLGVEGGCSSYNVYSSKLCYQLTTDVSVHVKTQSTGADVREQAAC